MYRIVAYHTHKVERESISFARTVKEAVSVKLNEESKGTWADHIIRIEEDGISLSLDEVKYWKEVILKERAHE